GIELSFGAIGKGWAVARGVRLLEQFGVAAALLSAGGSTLYALGAPPDSEGWTIEIPHPEDAASPAEVVHLRDCAFSTSGGTEQFFEVDGRRYSHILDPRTGYPADKLLSVSVCAPDPTLTDALSTALFVGGQPLIEHWQHRPQVRIWHSA
ncbi:MAG: FAD:protein FMN transferase, partial [Fimbriimonadales bacterium]|nr:FAD:protein FMN transferase [Fimbriimonadales bacterium]